jgi:hypothetical protein
MSGADMAALCLWVSSKAKMSLLLAVLSGRTASGIATTPHRVSQPSRTCATAFPSS